MSNDVIDRRSLLALLAGTSTGLCGSVAVASDKDGGAADDRPENVRSQAIGAFGVGYIQSTLGLIGVLADSIAKEMYNLRKFEFLTGGIVTGLDGPKQILSNLKKSTVTRDDAEFLDRMIGLMAALQQETRSLAVFAKSRKPADAAAYEKDRQRVLKKLAELIPQESVAKPNHDSSPSNPKSKQTPPIDRERRSSVIDDRPD